MKQLPKIARVSLDEMETKKGINPVVAGVIATMISGVSIQASASTDTQAQKPGIQNEVSVKNGNGIQSAVILNKPALDGQVFAAHYSHSSHSSHSSHYSCTPGSTC